ncbi:MAG: sterol desaturase family protein [Verrucomicrobiota bacterium]
MDREIDNWLRSRERGYLGLIICVLVLAFCGKQVLGGELSHVIDETGLLSVEQRAEIQEIGERLYEEREIPIFIAIIRSLAAHGADGKTIEQYTKSLVDQPVEGLERLDGHDWTSGILFVFAREDDAISVYMGYGWDEESQATISASSSEVLKSYFGRHEDAAGIVAMVARWDAVTGGLAEPGLSYWDRFLMLQKGALVGFLERVRNPSWRFLFEILPWVVFPFFIFELVRPWRKKQRRFREEFGLDVFYTFFNQSLFWVLIGTAITGITSLIFRDVLHRFFGIEDIVAIRLNELPVWVRYLLLLLTIDFISYWTHRMLHRFDFLWEFHKVHHSAKELDVFNAIRLHFVENLVYRLTAYIPLGLIGFAVQDVFIVGIFIQVFSYFTHANVRVPLGPLKYVLNNPQLHIWHHTVEVHDRGNVNFGDALSIWDFIFGTGYAPSERTDLKLGFEKIEEYPTTFFGQLVAPFTAIGRRFLIGRGPGADEPPGGEIPQQDED